MSVSPLAKDDAPARAKSYALLDDPRVLGWGSIVLVLVVWELSACDTDQLSGSACVSLVGLQPGAHLEKSNRRQQE